MFGIFRFLLATAVVIMHLTPATRIAGYQAVFSFYILSGYLMTRVLNETYGFSAKGRARFVINRILRIFPPYWVAVLISFPIVAIVPALARNMNAGLIMPESITDWLLNVFIIFHSPPGETSRLIPPVWTLHVEWVYYLLMCFVLSRNKTSAYAWFFISVLCTAVLYSWVAVTERKFVDFLYFSTVAGSLPFSVGATLYFATANRNSPVKTEGPLTYFMTLLSLICFYTFTSIIYNYYDSAITFQMLLYGSILFSGYVVLILRRVNLASFWIKTDQILGNLSYPIYLLHWPIAVWVTWGFFASKKQDNLQFFIVSYAITIAISLLINFYVEKPVGNVRNIFRRFETR